MSILAPAGVLLVAAVTVCSPPASADDSAGTRGSAAAPAEPSPSGPTVDELLGPPRVAPGPTVAELLGPPPGRTAPRAPAADGLPSAWFWATAGLALGAGIGGAIAGGMAQGDEEDYRVALTACRAGVPLACTDGPRIVADFEDHRLATNILLFSAGGLAVAALVLAFFTDFGLAAAEDDAGATASTVPRLLLGDASGVGLAWHF